MIIVKKQAAAPLLMLLLCCTPKPHYHAFVETAYNLNPSAVRLIMDSDTLKADFTAVEKKESTFIYERKSDFIFKVSKNPNQIEMIDSKGDSSKWTEERGYRITSKKNGDTLIIRFFSTRDTPGSEFKFGTEYKFF